ncbi:putative hypothetical protein [Streptomyces sp. NBRC 110611]|uniref:hypothetical protein n=1 Tax=Streptomyces sp. NBRC 110611 TaxID=1621259 RepID=UPI000831DB6F|nr:hypothetical protein [Streptomyces sp. NBRC 110611]GAU65934.1 putative hypothetical protein [Streptomyces sp. NBRC 110611]
MITIETYCRTEAGEFLPFESMSDFSSEFDLIEGAVEITIDGQTLIGIQEWDYVFPLWAYITDMAAELGSVNSASLRFPDQPIRIDALRGPNGIRLHLHGGALDRTVVANEAEFLEAVHGRGKSFFEGVISQFPTQLSVIATYRDKLEELHENSSHAVRWEERIGSQKVAAFREAERQAGRRLTPAERESLITEVAGCRIAFQDLVMRVIRVLEKG